MKKRQLVLTLGLFITGIIVLLSSCKKINEATELGGDLIPPVDNINTFDTIIDVSAYNGLFTISGPDPLLNDSTYSQYTDEQFVGKINADPLFGTTDARMYFQVDPVFPFAFNNRPDSLIFDSVVLVVNHVETYGDSTIPQTINVYEIDSTADFRVDTAYLVRVDPNFSHTHFLGSTTITPSGLDDSVKVAFDTTTNQLRIRLNDAFGLKLLKTYDTTTSGGRINAYTNDSTFKAHFNGFVLQSVSGGNAVMGFNLSGNNTKLAIYYRYLHGSNTGDYDSTVAYFKFTDNSALVNYVQRGYGGTPIQAAQGGTTPDAMVYIQNTPGSFATLKIPGLINLSNRVIHRAELIAEEEYDPSDAKFTPPDFLFLDAYNPAISKYMLIPYDLVPDNTGTLNYGSFGVVPVNAVDGAGNSIKTWHFNITRYIQHVANQTEPVYDLRLFSPVRITGEQYRLPVPGSTPALYPQQFIPINSELVKGRIRVRGNTATPSSPDTNPHRLRLRIVYSKL